MMVRLHLRWLSLTAGHLTSDINATCYARIIKGVPISDYEPGYFYKKELPIIMQAFGMQVPTPQYIIVDSYVWLGPDAPGMGKRLYDALLKAVPVIGIAKTHYAGADPTSRSIVRGQSKRPSSSHQRAFHSMMPLHW